MKASRILIVEDDNDIREMVQEFLEHEGFEVDAFSNGHLALEFLALGGRPRLIMLDWRMPVMSGEQFLVKYREQFDENLAPIYIFSAEQDAERFVHTGVKGVIKKPIDFNAIVSLIKAIA